MAKPLSLLRKFTIEKKEIIERDNEIIFGNLSYPKNVETIYESYTSITGNKPIEYYTLEGILYLLKNVQLMHPWYVRKAIADNIQIVQRPDRKQLLSFLNGEIPLSVIIPKNRRVIRPRRLKRKANDGMGSGFSKKPRYDDNWVDKVTNNMDAQQEISVTLDNTKSLSNAISVEEIPAINTNPLNQNGNNIKENNDISTDSNCRENQNINDRKEELVSEEHQEQTDTDLKSVTKGKNPSMIKKPSSNVTATYTPTPKHLLATNTSKIQVYEIDSKAIDHGITYTPTPKHLLVSEAVKIEGYDINTIDTSDGMTYTPTPKLLLGSTAKITPHQIAQIKGMNQTPIIIIPNINTSLITMYNVKEILQDLMYISNDDKRKSGSKRENEIILERRKNNNLTISYRIVDTPQKLDKDDWQRVVAVFVMGPTWQFKGWPQNGNPVEIFSKVAAFHLKYDDMKLDTNIAGWAVSVIELSRTKRHLDRAALIKFWEHLDKFMIKNTSHSRS